jgi:hypothetical protein
MSGNDPLAGTQPRQRTAAGSTAWIENWFRPTVTAAMLTCIVVAFVELVGRIVPGWRGLHYVAFAFVVSWVGIQSERLLRSRGLGYPIFRYRAVEAVVILALFKLVRYLPLGWDVLWTDVRQWVGEPEAFVDYGFVVGGMSILVLWTVAIAITKNLYLLEVHPSELPPDRGSPGHGRWTPVHGQRVDRQAVLRDVTSCFFWGGTGLLLFTGLARFDIPRLYRYTPPPLSGLVVNAVIYFLLGLALISQARYSISQALWRIGRIDVSPQLSTRWTWQTIAFLALLMLIALALPTGYSVGLPQAISALVTAVISALSVATYVLISVVSLLLGLLLTALRLGAEPIVARRPPPQPLSFQPGLPGTTAGHSWFELLKSSLFWGICLAILGYSTYHFLRERSGLIPSLKGGLLGRLIAWLHALWQGPQSWSAQVRKAIRKRLSRQPAQAEAAGQWWFVRLSRLSPRERVRYFYLSFLRRAARAGHARRPQQTPYEYRHALAEYLPEVATEATTLTQAFVEARYSQRVQDEQEANTVKKVWQRIRATLARTRHSQRSRSP